MAKTKSVAFEVDCPCCGATLKIDPEVKAILSHKAKPAARTLDDISTGIAKLKDAEQQREDAFQKSFQAVKSNKDVLSRKFDELLKQAKEEDPTKPPPKPFDLD